MSCGMPCIGAKTEGIKEIIKHKYNGILCDVDEKSISDAIKLIYQQPDLKCKISDNARKTIEKNYDLNIIVQKELQIYKELLEIKP